MQANDTKDNGFSFKESGKIFFSSHFQNTWTVQDAAKANSVKPRYNAFKTSTDTVHDSTSLICTGKNYLALRIFICISLT